MTIKSIIHRLIYEQRWTLGFIEQSLSDIVNKKPYEVHYVLSMPSDCWFADPFILDYDDCVIQVLVEEYNYRIRRGRIAKLVINRSNYELLSHRIILDLPSHLSFPFIYRNNGTVYVCPENSASGSWTMYEYDKNSESLKIVKTLVKEPLTDAIITDYFIDTLAFATCLPTPNGNILQLYKEDGNLDVEITFPSNIARNAGAWFKVGDDIYRPAQDCDEDYGRGVIIQKVTRKDRSFSFENVRRIESDNPKYTTGCHTFNSYKNLIVIDVHGWRRSGLARLFNRIKGI